MRRQQEQRAGRSRAAALNCAHCGSVYHHLFVRVCGTRRSLTDGVRSGYAEDPVLGQTSVSQSLTQSHSTDTRDAHTASECSLHLDGGRDSGTRAAALVRQACEHGALHEARSVGLGTAARARLYLAPSTALRRASIASSVTKLSCVCVMTCCRTCIACVPWYPSVNMRHRNAQRDTPKLYYSRATASA